MVAWLLLIFLREAWFFFRRVCQRWMDIADDWPCSQELFIRVPLAAKTSDSTTTTHVCTISPQERRKTLFAFTPQIQKIVLYYDPSTYVNVQGDCPCSKNMDFFDDLYYNPNWRSVKKLVLIDIPFGEVTKTSVPASASPLSYPVGFQTIAKPSPDLCKPSYAEYCAA